MQAPSVIYKYVDRAGALKIIKNSTLKFTIPQNLNDPFDLFIDDWMNFDKDMILNKFYQFQIEMLKKDPFQYYLATRNGTYDFGHMSQIGELSSAVDSFDEEKYNYLIDNMCEFIPKHLLNPIHEDVNRRHFVERLLGAGIFSCTSSKDNLLMWAHYAEQHRGIVIGLDAYAINSIAELKKVSYSEKRFSYYEMIHRLAFFGKSKLKSEISEFFYGSVLSKSPDWSYEDEFRSIILGRSEGPHRDRLVLIGLDSIKEIYFGIRSDKEFQSEILQLIKAAKMTVELYESYMERNLYKLKFSRFS